MLYSLTTLLLAEIRKYESRSWLSVPLDAHNCLMLSLHILTSTVEFHGKREGAPPTTSSSSRRRRSNVRSFFPLPQLISSEAGLAKSEATASDRRVGYPKPGHTRQCPSYQNWYCIELFSKWISAMRNGADALDCNFV